VRPYLLARRPLLSLAAQGLRVAALLAVDLGGLTVGVYVALVLREVYVGQVPIVWSGLWDTETTWLPFLFVVTILSFWRAGLYAPREMRPGLSAILASLALSGVLTFAIAIGAAHEFGSYGLVPLVVAITAALIGSLRASLDAVAARLYKLAGRRRHILLVAGPSDLGRLRHTIAGARADEPVEFFDAMVGPSRDGIAAAVRAIANPAIDEVVVADTDLLEADLLVRDHRRLEQRHRKHSLVVPGKTGLWQVSGRSDLPFDDLIRLDFDYLENWSIRLDITIVLRTIPAVLSRRGAY